MVTNTPDVLTNACADFTWALILAITRRLGEGERQVRSGTWAGWALDHLLGMELRGKQLGLVGMGRIARAVAEKAPAFGMSVAYADQAVSDAPGRHVDVAGPAAGDLRRGVAARQPHARPRPTSSTTRL